MLVSNLEMSTEPTTNETTETGIQHLINRLFPCEMQDDSNSQISADEQYAIETFNANLKFEDGSYWVRPLFKKDFRPMLKNNNIALRRYKSLQRQLSKDPTLEN